MGATTGKRPGVAQDKPWNGGTGSGFNKGRPVGGPHGPGPRMRGRIGTSGQMYLSGFPMSNGGGISRTFSMWGGPRCNVA